MVWGKHEVAWAYGLLSSIGLLRTYAGELIVLAPHGWTTGERGAGTPTLTELGARPGTSAPVEIPSTDLGHRPGLSG